MRIHRVEIAGFGPFRERQVVDLDSYAADGIFLIAGRTGAGKSSILDAICFALYGSVPRYESGDKRLRSDHAEPEDITEVVLQFTAAGRTWRITRTPEYERPKKRGDGTTTAAPTIRIEELVDGTWIGRAARAVEADPLVADIIGLNKQQFLQVILLAQGRFARFLLAKNDERQALLRTLFGTKRFEDYEKSLDEQRKAAEARVENQSRGLDVQLDHAAELADSLVEPLAEGASMAERIEWATRAALVARHAAEATDAARQEAQKSLAAAETAHQERVGQREKQERLAGLRASFAALEARAGEIDELRAERDAASRAEPVRTARDAVTRALGALNRANDAFDAASEAWAHGRSDSAPAEDAETAELEEFVAATQRRIGAWGPLRETEAGLDAEARAVAQLEVSLTAVVEKSAALDERAAALPAELERLRAGIEAATALAATVDARTQDVAALEGQLAAARSVAQLAEAQRDALDAAQKAKARRDQVEAHLDDLRRRRFAGMAGELAAELVDGEACTVCGSTTHPVPAARADDAVTADDVERADAERATASAAYEAANAKLNDATRAHEAALKDAGGRSVDELTDDLDDARAALTAADAAASAKQKLADERAGLEAEAAQHNAEREELAGLRSELQTRIEAATATLSQNRAAVADARGASASVAERIDAEQTLARLATALLTAQAEAARAEAAAIEAGDAFEAAVREAGFAGPDESLAALRDAGRRAALDERIQSHDTDLAAAKRGLLDLELEMLPDEPVDTAASGDALAEAKRVWETAVDLSNRATQRAQSLEAAVAKIEQNYAEIAGLRAEADRIKRLADTIAGRANNTKRMKLETFVLAAELEEIVQQANIRLEEMSRGRFGLVHSDRLAARGAQSGLGLEVMDSFTGRPRPVESLSGGERFLASLALALGLAEVVTNRAGGIKLDTLFIDEGFGSLDAETLDTAMQVLDELRSGGRTVGIISHVEAMKEQIPAQLRVEQTSHGWSVVRQG